MALLPPTLARMGQIPASFLTLRVRKSRTRFGSTTPQNDLRRERESHKPRIGEGLPPIYERSEYDGGSDERERGAGAECVARG